MDLESHFIAITFEREFIYFEFISRAFSGAGAINLAKQINRTVYFENIVISKGKVEMTRKVAISNKLCKFLSQ